MRGARLRLSPLRRDELVGGQADLYEALIGESVRSGEGALNDQGEVRGPFVTLLHHPSSGRPLQELTRTLRFEGRLSDCAREAVILAVAAHWRDAHEWASHERVAREVGISDEQLVALHEGADVTFADPVVQAAFEAASAIAARGDLTDAEYARIHAMLGDEEIVEVTVLIGLYALLAMQLRVFRVPADSTY
jgi:4-carboxymuconolactone decarboxylase